MRLRIATFNVENLVSRNAYGPKARPQTGPALSLFDFADPQMREHIQAATAVALEDDERLATALAIAETRADILCLQEVDGIGVLGAVPRELRPRGLRHPLRPHAAHAGQRSARHRRRLLRAQGPVRERGAGARALLEGRHLRRSRGSMIPSWRPWESGAGSTVFNRDCLEVSLDCEGIPLTLFICHMKSSGYGPRGASPALRTAEARAVRAIVERRFGEGWREASWIVAGDLNASPHAILPVGEIRGARAAASSRSSAISPSTPVRRCRRRSAGRTTIANCRRAASSPTGTCSSTGFCSRPRSRPRAAPTGGGSCAAVCPTGFPLDPAAPDRSIGGLAPSAIAHPRIGWDRPRASDHCPLVVELTLPPARRLSHKGGPAPRHTFRRKLPMPRRYAVLDVFTDTALEGNPLAVVLDSEGLDTAAMQAIAREFGLSETVFVLPPDSDRHRARLRIFTPMMELPFAGHPTVGSAVAARPRARLRRRRRAGLRPGGDHRRRALRRRGREPPEGPRALSPAEAARALRRGREREQEPGDCAMALGLDPDDIGFDRHTPSRPHRRRALRHLPSGSRCARS